MEIGTERSGRALVDVRMQSSIRTLTILDVTGTFSILAESIYSLCKISFKASLYSADFSTFRLWTATDSFF